MGSTNVSGGPSGIISERLLTGTPKSLWYHFGPQGETRRLTNSSGTTVDTYRYTAYGTQLGTTGTDANPFRYGGKVGYYTDPNVSGAILAGQRWYLPGVYRWQSRDPIRYDGGDNLYAYVNGNPVRFVDADGLLPTTNETGRPVRYKSPDDDWGTRTCDNNRTCDMEIYYPKGQKPQQMPTGWVALIYPTGKLVKDKSGNVVGKCSASYPRPLDPKHPKYNPDPYLRDK